MKRRNPRKTAAAPRPALDWVARVLARAGTLPLAQAEAAVRAGRVTVSGRRVHQPLAAVAPTDEVRLDGRRVETSPPTRVLAFHKPRGVVTSTVDPEGGGTVFERLAAALPAGLAGYTWHAVGRLDRDTDGLLLFTNDEKLVAHVTSPASKVPKRYRATVQGRPTEERLAPLRQGLEVDGTRFLPAHARAVGPHAVELTLTEGRYHQVKRMLAGVGLPVTRLTRVAVGGIELDVAEGQVRELAPQELSACLGYPPPGRRGSGPRGGGAPG